jgi:hypothetical protein
MGISEQIALHLRTGADPASDTYSVSEDQTVDKF